MKYAKTLASILFFAFAGIMASQKPAWAIPPAEIIIERLRTLGIVESYGHQVDEARLRTIAEELRIRFTSSTLTPHKMLERIRELMTKRFVTSLSSEMRGVVKELDAIMAVERFESLQALTRLAIGPLDRAFKEMKGVPPHFVLGATRKPQESDDTVATEEATSESRSTMPAEKLTKSLHEGLRQIERFSQMLPEEQRTQWLNFSQGPLQALRNDIAAFYAPLDADFGRALGLAQTYIFEPTEPASTFGLNYDTYRIHPGYLKPILDSLEEEEGTATLGEITRELIYYAATRDTEPPKVSDELKRAAGARWKSFTGTTMGALTIGETVGMFLGQTTGLGLGVAGAIRVAAFGVANYSDYAKWKRARELWIVNELRRLFNAEVALPLGVSPTLHAEDFDRTERLFCGAALESNRNRL